MTLFAVVVLVNIAGFLVGSWACADVIFRPGVLFRVANVNKRRWLVGLASLVVAMAVCGVVVAIGHAPRALPMLCWAVLLLASLLGLTLGGWYLGIVRPWVASQLRFARH